MRGIMKILGTAVVGYFGVIGMASAVPCTNGAVYEEADPGNEMECAGDGAEGDTQPSAAEIQAFTGGGAWTELNGSFVGGNGSSDPFTFDIGSLWEEWGEIVAVIKTGAGSDTAVDDKFIFWSAYVLEFPITEYGVDPCDDGSCQGRGWSGLYFFGRGEPTYDVPEPGTLGLLGLGLAALGFGVRRRKA